MKRLLALTLSIAAMACGTTTIQTRHIPSHIDLEGKVTELKTDKGIMSLGQIPNGVGKIENKHGIFDFKFYNREFYKQLKDAYKNGVEIGLDCRQDNLYPCYVSGIEYQN